MNDDPGAFRLSLCVVVALSPLSGSAWGAASAPAGKARLAEMAALLGLDADASPAVTAQAAAAQGLVEQLVARGLGANAGLAAETARVAARDADVGAARAAYQPALAATGSANAQRERDVAQSATARTITEQVGLTLRENLYHGGQDARQVEVAERDRLLATLTRSTKSESVAYLVRQAALQYNYASMGQLLATAAADDAAEFRGLTERKFAAGQVGKVDVYTAAVREGDARAQAVKAGLSAAEAAAALWRALGLAGTADTALTQALAPLARVALPYPGAPPALAPPNAATLSEQSAAAATAKSELTLAQAYGSRYLPTVDATASVSRARNNTSGDPSLVAAGAIYPQTSQTLQYSVGVTLNWPLWQRPADYQIVAAAAERDAAALSATQARTDAQMTAATLRRHIAELYQTLPPYKEAYVLAGRLYDAQRKLYAAGAVDVFVVTDADSQRLKALGNWHDAVFAVKQDLLKWQALGRGYLPPAG